MNYEDVTRYLCQAQELSKAVDLLYMEHEKQHKEYMKLVSCGLDDQTASSCLRKLVDRDRQVVMSYAEKYLEISALIFSLKPGPVREVLERRYLLGQSWRTKESDKGGLLPGIPEEMGYSRERVMQLHRAGLKLLKQLLEKK